jgi:hypothetical protein
MIKRSDPLVLVALSLIPPSDQNSTNGTTDLESVAAHISEFLNGSISFEQARDLLMTKVGSSAAIERLQAILTVPPDPLPDPPAGRPMAPGNRRKTSSWTHEEDIRLLAGIHLYGLEKWPMVAQFVGNGRSRAQCSQRWIRGLDPRITKTHWSPDDDRKLIALVSQHGEKSWMKVSLEMGNRSDVQCRYRYRQIQQPGDYGFLGFPLSPEPSPPHDERSALCPHEYLGFEANALPADPVIVDFTDDLGQRPSSVSDSIFSLI